MPRDADGLCSHKNEVGTVEVMPGSRVKVTINSEVERFKVTFLTVEFSCSIIHDSEPTVVIYGGNTGSGDMLRYRDAIIAYESAVNVAERFQIALSDPADLFSGYRTGDLKGCVQNFPDYVLAAYLILKGHTGFYYKRGFEPNGHEDFLVYDLAGLRAKVLEVVLSEQAVA